MGGKTFDRREEPHQNGTSVFLFPLLLLFVLIDSTYKPEPQVQPLSGQSVREALCGFSVKLGKVIGSLSGQDHVYFPYCFVGHPPPPPVPITHIVHSRTYNSLAEGQLLSQSHYVAL
ncbi:hypothetical protein JZ751_029950, partial [Albula glossodonta]